MTIGSGALSYDYGQQAAKNPQQILKLADYVAALQTRSVNLMNNQDGPRTAPLPQISKSMGTSTRMATASFDWPERTNAQQIDDFVKDSPQLQVMLKADHANAKKTWWARVRHKISGDDAQPRSDRLAGIRDRNFPKPRDAGWTLRPLRRRVLQNCMPTAQRSVRACRTQRRTT